MKGQREKKRRIELFRASYCSLDSKTTVTVDRTAFIYETRSTFDFLLKISAECFLVRGMCPVSDVMLGRTELTSLNILSLLETIKIQPGRGPQTIQFLSL